MPYLLAAAAILVLLGLLLLWTGRRRRAATGLPAGEVVYSDTGMWQEVREPLRSRRYGLVGRPDYLVQVTEKGRQVTVPVEVKSRKQPARPLDGHVLQLGAYCLLVEDQLQDAAALRVCSTTPTPRCASPSTTAAAPRCAGYGGRDSPRPLCAGRAPAA